MPVLTNNQITELLATIDEQGLPQGGIEQTADTVTLHVADRAAVQTWAEHLDEPLIATPTDGYATTGYATDGFSFRVVANA